MVYIHIDIPNVLKRGLVNTNGTAGLVLSRLETKLSVALIFVIARSALHFKNFVIVSN